MKSRDTLIRLKKFQVDEKRRRVAQIEGMIADFQRMSVDLEREIQLEQDRAGIQDPSHFAYPTYAKAAIQRRENLTRSADELRGQLEDAKAVLGEAFEELKKVELLDERDQARERAEESAREQADLDSIGLMRSRIAMALGESTLILNSPEMPLSAAQTEEISSKLKKLVAGLALGLEVGAVLGAGARPFSLAR